MQYTTLGKRTGWKVSVLGFGAMRLPMHGRAVDRDKAIPMIHRAFELGVNYIDSAVFYCNGDSQAAVGEALASWKDRDRIIVSTKNHAYGRKDYNTWRQNLEDSLRMLRTECIDVYNMHGLSWAKFEKEVDGPGGSYEWMSRAKDEGLIRHICFSFHDKPESLEKLARTGMFDVVTCQYNLLDRANEQAIKLCHDEGMGVVVMGPVGGGRLGAPSEQLQSLVPGSRSVPEVALRFVLANPGVSVALSGMSSVEHVEENCRIASRKTALGATEKQRIHRVLKKYRKLAELYCTGCNYCMPCPSGVDIPWMFATLNNHRVYGLSDLARRDYARAANSARLCVACGKCLEKCPQGIAIINQLHETIRTLDENYGKLAADLLPGRLQKLRRNGSTLRMELRGQLRLVNISDRQAQPRASFAADGAVQVSLGAKLPAIHPFEQKRVPVTIHAVGRPGEAMETALTVTDEHLEPLPGPTALALAIAPSGGETALAKAPAIALVRDDAKCKPRKTDLARHGSKFAFAYDRDALYVRASLKDDLAYPVRQNRPIHSADRIELGFDLSGLARPQGSRPPAYHWRLVVSTPSQDQGDCSKWMRHPWDRNADGIDVTAKKNRAGVTLTIRIPWDKLDCPPGRGGNAVGLTLAHVSHSRTGKVNYHRQWVDRGGWLLLAPEEGA